MGNTTREPILGQPGLQIAYRSETPGEVIQSGDRHAPLEQGQARTAEVVAQT